MHNVAGPGGRAVQGVVLRPLRLWVRIPQAAWMFACCECCVMSDRGILGDLWLYVLATSWSLVQRSPTECGVSECDRGATIMRRPWSTGGCCPMVKKCTMSVCNYVIKRYAHNMFRTLIDHHQGDHTLISKYTTWSTVWHFASAVLYFLINLLAPEFHI